jgi:CBS domain-containing protein
MARTVAEVMHADPRTVSRDSRVVDVARMMAEDDIGSVPVVDGDTVVGMLTDRDIALRVVAAGLDPRTTAVGEVASSDVHFATPDASLDDVFEQMSAWQIRRLPVVEDNRLVGIVAQADLVHELTDKKAGRLVDEISKPGEPSYRNQTVGIG